MKEFVLTQSYATIDEMINSDEVAIYKNQLAQSNEQEYAIVSRIGNHYDLYGSKIEGYAVSPFFKHQDDVVEIKEEGEKMKYAEIEAFIDNEIAKAVEEVKVAYEKEIAELKENQAIELANAKEQAKAELIAKLSA